MIELSSSLEQPLLSRQPFLDQQRSVRPPPLQHGKKSPSNSRHHAHDRRPHTPAPGGSWTTAPGTPTTSRLGTGAVSGTRPPPPAGPPSTCTGPPSTCAGRPPAGTGPRLRHRHGTRLRGPDGEDRGPRYRHHLPGDGRRRQRCTGQRQWRELSVGQGRFTDRGPHRHGDPHRPLRGRRTRHGHLSGRLRAGRARQDGARTTLTLSSHRPGGAVDAPRRRCPPGRVGRVNTGCEAVPRVQRWNMGCPHTTRTLLKVMCRDSSRRRRRPRQGLG